MVNGAGASADGRNWDKRLIGVVRQLAQKGWSARQIALEMAKEREATRNAIIGIARRHNITLKGGPQRPEPLPRVKPIQRTAGGSHFRSPVTRAKAMRDVIVPPDHHSVGFFQLKPRHCRWPVGSAAGLAMLYCGRVRLLNSSYCERCFGLSKPWRKEREWEAAEVPQGDDPTAAFIVEE